MKPEEIREITEKIKRARVAVYGDFCLDAYWMLDPRGSEVSVETGLCCQAVGRHSYSLGGTSNTVANLAALQPAQLKVIGVIGPDIFGRELTRQFQELGVDTAELFVQPENFDTTVFGKPYLEGVEQPRMDFGFFNVRSEESAARILRGIEEALQAMDVLIFQQQVPGSLSASFIAEVNQLLDRYADKIVLLDSRHYGAHFYNIYRKTNDLEVAQLNGASAKLGDVINLADVKRYAQALNRRSGKPVFVTRGPRGMLVADAEGVQEIPGIQLLKKLDPVGAGDTSLSALALCLAVGVKPAPAAQFANFAASVTVQKLFQTGTATAAEIIEIGSDPDYVYQPELAADTRLARYFPGTEIEHCYELAALPLGRIRHAVFDHDGTISVLRQGWEAIMEPVMVKAILGDSFATADENLYHKVLARVRSYIDQSTGIETHKQMTALVEMVREFGIVPAGKILDKWGYKQIYNDALMELVNSRIEKFRRGELDLADFTMKGALQFLEALRARGVKLYLASGTDRDDVIAEADALGYGPLFEGRIYGSVGDSAKFSKKVVIDTILRENHLTGAELLVVGDGPVELREGRKRDGLALGIASDEVRRFGLSREKRTRLIKAGAHLVIPDFSQLVPLMNFLLS